MDWTVEFHHEFEREFNDSSEAVQDAILARAGLLALNGPQLGRPYADTLHSSRHANMKELRFDADGGIWRVAFAFVNAPVWQSEFQPDRVTCGTTKQANPVDVPGPFRHQLWQVGEQIFVFGVFSGSTSWLYRHTLPQWGVSGEKEIWGPVYLFQPHRIPTNNGQKSLCWPITYITQGSHK